MARITILIAATLLPGVAAAHPQHTSGGDFGLMHFATDPFHVGLTAGVTLAVLAVRRFLLQRRALGRMDR